MLDEIKSIIEILRNGGIILYPTDTIWGIGCDATNKEAVEKIYQLKKRADAKSMIILVHDLSMIYNYVHEVPDIALQLIEVNDQPMTLIYPNAINLAENTVNSDGTIAIRITSDPFCKELIKRFKKPLISTSANISGQKSPDNFRSIAKPIIEGVDYVVKHRQNDNSKTSPSSIIKVGIKGEIEIIRR
jgi:L-threonylcarbamoyladenylate synthase